MKNHPSGYDPQGIDPLSGACAHPLLHDWNASASSRVRPELVDETLRDGLQSPSASDPPLAKKIELFHQMARLGIDCVALGFPASRRRQYDDVLELAREAKGLAEPLQICCAARTLRADIEPIADIAQRVGCSIQVGMFIGSSPIRQHTEGWTLDRMLRLSQEAVEFAVQEGLEVLYVTEDTTRSRPDVLEKLYTAAIRSGARSLCIADTAGHSTPSGVTNLVQFVRRVADACDPTVRIEWHGHRDRGLDVANCLAAWQAGANRCHGTALGIGERSGNAPIELLLVNLALLGLREVDLSVLPAYVRNAASALGFSIPPHYPVVGRDAFRTATGPHAAAVIKAQALGEEELANRVYSSVPAELVGRRQVIDVGPCSGEANVAFWLAEHGIPPSAAAVAAVLAAAKRGDRVLDEHEILEIANQQSEARSGLHLASPRLRSERPSAPAAGQVNR